MSGPYTERIEPAVTDGARDAEELRQKAEVVARGGARLPFSGSTTVWSPTSA